MSELQSALRDLNETIKALRTELRDHATNARLHARAQENLQRDTLHVLKDIRTLVEALRIVKDIDARVVALESAAAAVGG